MGLFRHGEVCGGHQVAVKIDFQRVIAGGGYGIGQIAGVAGDGPGALPAAGAGVDLNGVSAGIPDHIGGIYALILIGGLIAGLNGKGDMLRGGEGGRGRFQRILIVFQYIQIQDTSVQP